MQNVFSSISNLPRVLQLEHCSKVQCVNSFMRLKAISELWDTVKWKKANYILPMTMIHTSPFKKGRMEIQHRKMRPKQGWNPEGQIPNPAALWSNIWELQWGQSGVHLRLGYSSFSTAVCSRCAFSRSSGPLGVSSFLQWMYWYLQQPQLSSVDVLVPPAAPAFFSGHIGTFSILGSPLKCRFHCHRFIQPAWELMQGITPCHTLPGFRDFLKPRFKPPWLRSSYILHVWKHVPQKWWSFFLPPQSQSPC